MVDYCRTRDIVLLCYGTVVRRFSVGALAWQGRPNRPGGPFDLPNRSLVKYKLIIDDFGGWDLFQQLLAQLARIAAKHNTDVASIASRALLDRPQVAAVIVGATNTTHLQAHGQVGSIRLDAEDLDAIAAVTDHRRGPREDVYILERDRAGRHGQIMKYQLNAAPADLSKT